MSDFWTAMDEHEASASGTGGTLIGRVNFLLTEWLGLG